MDGAGDLRSTAMGVKILLLSVDWLAGTCGDMGILVDEVLLEGGVTIGNVDIWFAGVKLLFAFLGGDELRFDLCDVSADLVLACDIELDFDLLGGVDECSLDLLGEDDLCLDLLGELCLDILGGVELGLGLQGGVETCLCLLGGVKTSLGCVGVEKGFLLTSCKDFALGSAGDGVFESRTGCFLIEESTMGDLEGVEKLTIGELLLIFTCTGVVEVIEVDGIWNSELEEDVTGGVTLGRWRLLLWWLWWEDLWCDDFLRELRDDDDDDDLSESV